MEKMIILNCRLTFYDFKTMKITIKSDIYKTLCIFEKQTCCIYNVILILNKIN